MKFAATFGSATRAVGRLFFALMLLLVAIAAGFGGTALLVYHHLDSGKADRNATERKTTVQTRGKAVDSARDDARLRQVAALPSDQPHFTYADNNGGQPSVPAKRDRPVTAVPAALENATATTDARTSTASLNDPESHYIVDSRTGRVIGIDGSVGASREAEEERRRLGSAPRAVAVQTPAPEVRVASAVVEDGQAPPSTSSGSQYVPVRRALPVNADAPDTERPQFNIAEYMAGGHSRPVLRAQSVNTNDARASRTLRIYRLSDGSQVVSAN